MSCQDNDLFVAADLAKEEVGEAIVAMEQRRGMHSPSRIECWKVPNQPLADWQKVRIDPRDDPGGEEIPANIHPNHFRTKIATAQSVANEQLP
jgi:hypothetical protein